MCRESTKERKRTRALIFPLILLFHLCEYFIPQVELLGYICSDIQIKYVFCDNYSINLSRVVRKPTFCICENKDADQLRGNREADQRLCFRYTDSTIPLPPKSENSSLYPSSVTVQLGLCWTWSETPKTGFLRTRPIYQILHKTHVVHIY